MRAHLERLCERLFPGMGLRPLYLSALATWAMVVYHHQGSGSEAPRAFLEGSASLLGIADPVFHEHLWSHLSALVLLMLLPLAVCTRLEGWTPRDLGCGLRGAGREVGVVLALWAAMVPLVWAVHDTPSFARTYPRLPSAEHDPQMFLLYEGFYLVKWTAWEFFFRGFLLFGLGRDLLGRAVLVSTIPFTLMHFGKPELETATAFVAGLVLCLIAQRSRSIWPGVLLHWLVAGTMDFFAATWWRP
jgi:membrane protease YdiL (CAAX protease family)